MAWFIKYGIRGDQTQTDFYGRISPSEWEHRCSHNLFKYNEIKMHFQLWVWCLIEYLYDGNQEDQVWKQLQLVLGKIYLGLVARFWRKNDNFEYTLCFIQLQISIVNRIIMNVKRRNIIKIVK